MLSNRISLFITFLLCIHAFNAVVSQPEPMEYMQKEQSTKRTSHRVHHSMEHDTMRSFSSMVDDLLNSKWKDMKETFTKNLHYLHPSKSPHETYSLRFIQRPEFVPHECFHEAGKHCMHSIGERNEVETRVCMMEKYAQFSSDCQKSINSTATFVESCSPWISKLCSNSHDGTVDSVKKCLMLNIPRIEGSACTDALSVYETKVLRNEELSVNVNSSYPTEEKTNAPTLTRAAVSKHEDLSNKGEIFALGLGFLCVILIMVHMILRKKQAVKSHETRALKGYRALGSEEY